MEWLNDIRELPEGYFIIDSDEEPHDGDASDGRYGLYKGDFEFMGNLHDLKEIVDLAWQDFESNC